MAVSVSQLTKMLYFTKFIKLSSQILQNHALHVQQASGGASVVLGQQVRTVMTHDPSRFDPAKIVLTKGPKKIRKRHSMRNLPNRMYKDGDRVNANEVIRKQKAAVQWKAGQYVITGGDRTLNAQVSGTLKLTTEFNPDKVSNKRPKYFTDVMLDEAKLQTVVHVIPDEQHSRFKLVEQI